MRRESRGPYVGQAEDGYPRYYTTVYVVEPCGCEFTVSHTVDKPGFRDPTEYREERCEHGNDAGRWCTWHDTIHWQKVGTQ